MPPRRRSDTTAGLSAADVDALETALTSGKTATVYLRDPVPSLDLPAGASAKVVRFADGGVVVRPRGIDDELPFELDEVRITRNPPPPAKAATAPKPVPARASREQPEPVAAKPPAPAQIAAPERPAPRTSSPDLPTQPGKPRRASKKLAGVTVTIHGGTDNVWTVGVAHGPRPAGRSNPVSPEAVERAVAQLGDETARAAIDSVLAAARQEVTNRIDELNRQLAEARAALAALGSAD